MPVSKKAKIQREHRKADAAGTRAPVKANGLPVKAPKPTSICANCRKEIINTNLKQLEVHAETHDQKLWPKEKCWPDIFKGDVVEKPQWDKAVKLPAKEAVKEKEAEKKVEKKVELKKA